jgi:hypothetical protein
MTRDVPTLPSNACAKALLVAPDYIDAMFNLALLLQRKGAYAEAADHWRRYLAGDRASEWAARARRSLKFCEGAQSVTTGPRTHYCELVDEHRETSR